MDYPRLYARFIEDRRARPEPERSTSDRHHVVPRCLGGTDEADNLIRLSYSDHLFAHVLLARIHGGPLAVAAVRMSGMKKYNGGRASRLRYAHIRSRARQAMLGNTHCVGRRDTPETLKKRSVSITASRARPETRLRHEEGLARPEVREKLSAASRRAWESEVNRTAHSDRLRKLWQDPAYREKQTERMRGQRHALGHKQSEEACRRKSEASKAAWARRKGEAQ